MANPHASNESDGEREARALSHEHRRRLAEGAFHRAQQRLVVSPPASHAHAVADVERCRRVLLSLSGAPPTSSDEEAGRAPLFPSRRLPEGTRRLAVVSSDDDYYSTSSTSSGGSSTRDLEAKDALWCEYQRRPADVIARFDRLAQTSASASSDDPPKHEASCRRLRDSCKQIRVARRQARTEQRLSRWFSAKKEQEGDDVADDGDDVADDGDDEADNLRSRLELIVFLNRRRIFLESLSNVPSYSYALNERRHFMRRSTRTRPRTRPGQTKSKRAEEAKDLIEGEELLAKREPEKQDTRSRLTTWESGHVISKSDVQDFKFWGFNWDWRESDITDSIHLVSLMLYLDFPHPLSTNGSCRQLNTLNLFARPTSLQLPTARISNNAPGPAPRPKTCGRIQSRPTFDGDGEPEATLSAIEQELKTTFTEFNDPQSGVLRLQLTMAYVKTYGSDVRSHQTSKHQVDVQTKGGNPSAKERNEDGAGRSDTETTDDDAERSDDDAERSDAESRGDFAAGTRAADFNFNAAPDVKRFLSSFTPSLLYLYPTFVKAEITGQAQLDSIARWPRANVVEFFGGLADPFAAQTKGRGQGQAKLKKVVVEALVLRLKASEYKDGLD
ncbi:hypothetical protein B0H14DRAFT_2620468 [Mycena olivaceomarginata]|nr:hypothetical protein B0H14DRAFT_2620468 [Mycena olivaceomarginata]